MINKEDYFSLDTHKQYFSVSQYKGFLKCEAKEMAKLEGKWQDGENEAFLLGSYVHAWSEGTLEEFKSETPQLFKKDGTLLAKYDIGNKMIKTLEGDEMVTKLREGNKEVVMVGEIDGVPFKIMVDILNLEKGRFADLKTTKGIYNKVGGENFVQAYGYDIQMAIYQEIIRQNTGKVLEPYIIAVSKEAQPDKAIIYIEDYYLTQAMENVKLQLPRLKAVKEGKETPLGCGQCDYCKSVKKIEKILRLEDL